MLPAASMCATHHLCPLSHVFHRWLLELPGGGQAACVVGGPKEVQHKLLVIADAHVQNVEGTMWVLAKDGYDCRCCPQVDHVLPCKHVHDPHVAKAVMAQEQYQ